MKIAFLASRSGHTIKWINALAEAGQEVHWITQDTKHEQNDKVDKKVIIHQLKCDTNMGYYLNVLEIKKLLREIKPDILNAHNASGYGTSARLVNFHPYLLNAWGSDVYDMKNIFFKRMVIKNLECADKLASTSYGMADQMRHLMKNNKKEIEITPFGVDLNRFDINLNQDGKNDECFTIGVIKTLAPKYGIKMLIQSFKIVRDSLNERFGRELVFKIYGDGPQKQELFDYTKQLQMSDCVHFMGRIPNLQVPKALSEMDLFCLGSESESFGVAAVEAMAMKKAVIATSVTGFREVIEHGKSGILVEKNRPDLMAEAIINLIDNDEERNRLGENARKRVEQYYDLKDNVQTMLLTYQRLIMENAKNGCTS